MIRVPKELFRTGNKPAFSLSLKLHERIFCICLYFEKCESLHGLHTMGRQWKQDWCQSWEKYVKGDCLRVSQGAKIGYNT